MPRHQHCQLPWWRACSCAWWFGQQGWLNGTMSIAQHIGNFSTGKETPQPLSSHTELDLSLCYSVIAVIPFLFLILVILVCGCMCTWCCGLWTCRKGCSHSIRHKSKCYLNSIFTWVLHCMGMFGRIAPFYIHVPAKMKSIDTFINLHHKSL